MILTRRHAAVLFAIATWLVLSHLNFARNLYDAYAAGEDRPAGYWVAHTVLIVVNLVVAAVLARWGWQAGRGWNSSHPASGPRAQVARDRADP